MQLEQLVQTRSSGIRGLKARVVLPRLNKWAREKSDRKHERYVVRGQENLEQIEGPALWIPKHESWMDMHTLSALWDKMGTPLINGVSRSDYFPNSPIKSFLTSLLMRQTLFLEVERVGMSDASEKEKEKMQARNRKQAKRIQQYYQKGIHMAVLPEGTTKTDGRIAKIKSLAYNVSHVTIDGKTYVVPCVPVGNTIDFMASNKPSVFFNIGVPFYYQKVSDDVKGDIATFASTVKNAFMDLNTVTISQLGGVYLRKLAMSKKEFMQIGPFEETIEQQAKKLNDAGYKVDPFLLDTSGRTYQVLGFYNKAIKIGYINRNGQLNRTKILSTPNSRDFKQENMLLYCANRLFGIAEERKEVDRILKTHLL